MKRIITVDGMEIRGCIEVEEYTFRKRFTYQIVMDGRSSIVQSMPFGEVVDKKKAKRYLEDYGFDMQSMDAIIEEVMNLAAEGVVRRPESSVEDVYGKLLENFGQNEKKEVDGTLYLLISKTELEAWLHEATELKRLEFIKTLKAMGLLHTNPGRYDYRSTDGTTMYAVRMEVSDETI